MSEKPYPALQKFLTGRVSEGSRASIRTRVPVGRPDLAENLPSDAVAEVVSDLRSLLLNTTSEAELQHTLSSMLEGSPSEFDPPVGDRLHGLLALLEQRQRRVNRERELDQPRAERAARLRPRVDAEVGRIGIPDFALRTGVDATMIRRFIGGHTPLHGVLDAFDFYEFGLYPDFSSLMQYFHPSYDFESTPDNWVEVVNRFIAGEAAYVRGTVIDIDRILQTVVDEAELHRILREFGCNFVPARWGLTTREWLIAVQQRLAAHCPQLSS